MMATHGANPTQKTSIPEASPVAWSAFLKDDPKTRVRVKAQSWIKACARGAPLLGVLVEAVDAEKAVQA